MAKFKHVIIAGSFAWLMPMSNVSALTISDIPLFLDNGVVPNVLLNMSVESPMGGAAYADQEGNPTGCGSGSGSYATPRPNVGGGPVGVCYIPTQEYLGYFDPNKCYSYSSSRFNPDGATGTNHTCSSKWSGNFLNWATMTAIDMFTWTMTGGNRVTDTTTETVIRRARKEDNDSWFPHKLLDATYNVAPSSVTPYSDASIYIKNTSWGVEIGTTRGGSEKGAFDVKIKVCDSAQGLEANCEAYGGGTYHKPEGLIQKNANKMRFALTSYLNDSSQSRDGGVLRSKMKPVGLTYATPTGPVNNTLKEFGSDGILINNPDGAAGYNSGVINYINKFSDAGYKSHDPIGELYYESLRYFKNLGPTEEYHNNWTSFAGGFTVYTTWDDPIQYSCQKNFIVGINDANPWLDKRLPGTHFTCAKAGTPGLPASFTANDCDPPTGADGAIKAADLTNHVGSLEKLNGAIWTNTGTWASGPASGTNDSIGYIAGVAPNAGSCTEKTVTSLGEVMGSCPAPQKENSYYIAGLAYYANTNDLRIDIPDKPDKQTVSTYMIDTQEYNSNPLDGPKNMLWLAGKYGGFKDTNGDGDPNFSSTTTTAEWDADADGIPDNYVLASQPKKLVDGLTKAFNDIFKRTASAAAVASNSTRLTTTAHLYQALFNSGDWTGRLKAFPLDIYGNIGSEIWDAADKIPAHGDRKIKTWDGTAGVDFSGDTIAAAVGGATTLAYVRGDATQEEKNGGAFRDRTTKLGDIVNADPHYVKDENFGYNVLAGVEGTSYSTYKTGKSSRTAMVYAGANDGMLHGFQASDGVELFAFVPKSVWPKLPLLTSPTYSHKYFVDGSPTAWDAYWGTTWKTVLAGSLGAGGKSVYLLNVSSPDTFGDGDVLWEFKGNASDPNQQNNMGLLIGTVTVARFKDGYFWAVFGNGYDSVSGKAVLFMVRVDAPTTMVKMIDVGGTSNGLSSPLLVDTDGDRIVDLIYAGDLKGNLWKFDVTNNNPSSWASAYSTTGRLAGPAPLFQAKDKFGTPQPITSLPEVGLAPTGASGYMVYFGTGKYFETGDNATTSIQSVYGVVDSGTPFTGTDHRTQLESQKIEFEATIPAYVIPAVVVEDVVKAPAIKVPAKKVRVMSDNPVNYTQKKGWVIDLLTPPNPPGTQKGERMITAPALFNGKLILQSIVPTTIPCEFGGASWLMQVNPATGGRLQVAGFDVNGDGSFNSEDRVDIGGGVRVQVSGLDTDVGISGGFGKPIQAGSKAYVALGGTSGAIGAQAISGMQKSRASWRQLQ